MQDFRKLDVWREAHQLALSIYRLTASFPKEEIYGVTSQMRRASVSIASNIAEGCMRQSDADFGRFLHMAVGSVSELDYLVLLSVDLNFCSSPDAEPLQTRINSVRRMLIALIHRIVPTRPRSPRSSHSP